jgi:cell division protein FtsI/penicillin-binding protein 2
MRFPVIGAIVCGSWMSGALFAPFGCGARPMSAERSAVPDAEVSLSHTEPVAPVAPQPPEDSATQPDAGSAEPAAAEAPRPPGLDLVRMSQSDAAILAPAAGGTAQLTLDPDLQKTALQLMSMRHVPEGAVVVIDVATGRLLAYASHVESSARRDLCIEATAPSASVFKIVTAAALVEDAHLGTETQQCYSGGEQRINAIDLVDDPRRDKACATLASALGRSINTVFARLAKTYLSPAQLEAMARRFGYGEGLAFDVPVQPSALNIPVEPLEFARTAAGFWNTTLSPLQAAEMSAIVAHGGEAVQPSIVEKVVSEAGAVTWSAPETPASHRVIARDTAEQLGVMMEHTIGEGTSLHAFHDPRGAPFLPGIAVAGKTGTLTDAETHRYYSWFTGFAPSHPQPGESQVAIASLVVNGPVWRVKANVVARDVLRAYFAHRDAKGVTRPSVSSIARHRSR